MNDKPFIIAFANQKGGVAKTTTCECLAAGLRKKGLRVLVIDMDAQGNLSDNCGADTSDITMYDVLHTDTQIRKPLSAAIQHLDCFDICPSNEVLAGIESHMVMVSMGAPYRLKEAIFGEEAIVNQYDVILIDCCPSLGMLTINALSAANCVVIPANSDANSAKGICELKNTIARTQAYCNDKLRIAGVLITRYESNTKISRDFRESIEEIAKYGDESIQTRVYDTHIRKCITINRAHAEQVNILDYAPESNIARDYFAFTEEFLQQYPLLG